MPVFDTAAHVWRSPSYRQGKAIELANVNKQLVNQQLEQELEYYPEEFEQEKRKVDIAAEGLELRQEELEARVAEAQASMNKEDFQIAVAGAVAGLDAEERGEDPTEAMQAIYSAHDSEQDLSGVVYERQAALALRSTLKKDSDLKPTGKMIEAVSMGYEPGSPEYAAYLKGTGKDGKPLAAEVKAQMVVDALNGTFKGQPIDAEAQSAILDSLDVQRGPKGSITIKWDDAADYAESIIDRTGISESSWFTLQRNPQEFEDRLTWSLMRLAKDGGFGGKELEERALADSIGVEWNELLDAQAEKNANLPEDEQFSVMDMLKLLAEK